MKAFKIFAGFFLMICFSGSLAAQATEDPKSLTAFGGPSLINTSLAGEWTLEVGGEGGVFVTDNFYLGGAGYALSQETKNNLEYDLGYGGLMLGYRWGEREKIALNFYTLGGYGGISEMREGVENLSDDFWVVKPAVEVDFPIAKWLHLGIGGGYRWILGTNITSLEFADLSAPFSSITLRFGNWSE